jgi:hypothetical protein
MILLLELTHTKSGQNNKGVLIYTTADLRRIEGKVSLALSRQDPQTQSKRIATRTEPNECMAPWVLAKFWTSPAKAKDHLQKLHASFRGNIRISTRFARLPEIPNAIETDKYP